MTNLVVIVLTNIAACSQIDWSTNLIDWQPYWYTYVGAKSASITVYNNLPQQFWRYRKNDN